MTLPTATIARRLLSTYWVDRWTACPSGVPGQVDFDRDKAEDVAPFTVEQVRLEVGYVLLRFQEVDRWGGALSGDDAQGRRTRKVYTLDNLEFEVRTPSGSDVALEESYAAEIERLFVGVSIRHEDPLVSIRQLTKHPVRRRTGIDDGSFRTLFVDVKVERWERTALAGAQEVTLP